MEFNDFIEKFDSKDNRHFIIRQPTMSDSEGYFRLINGIIEENAPVLFNKSKSYSYITEYLANKIGRMSIGEEIAIVALENNKIIADASIIRGIERERDIGVLGIVVAKDYRNIGIGTKMLMILLEEAKKEKYRLIKLEIYANNKAAMHLYKKAGFVEAGIIPEASFFAGKYIDSILMYKKL
ncbi:MAG: GNAT family N-acetyltransferase [Candidatus Micrarchaeaceae archaeon]